MILFAERWKNHPSKIAYHLDKHHTTLNFHLQKLIDMDIVETFKFHNEIKYRLKNIEKVTDILISYDKSILADAFGYFFKYLENPPKDWTDRAMKRFYNVFPHPYHV